MWHEMSQQSSYKFGRLRHSQRSERNGRSLIRGRAIAPGLRMAAVVAAFHRDRAGRWADEIAEVAADAFGLDNVGITLAVDLLKSKL